MITAADLAPDTILANGKVLTVDDRFTVAQAVAVKDGRFVAVGADVQVRPLAGPRTRVLDVGGRTVIPGLIDGHAHMDREGLKGVFPSLGGARSIADIQDRVADLARRARPGEWIVTMPVGDPPYYWDVPDNLAERRFPNRWDLDRAAPDNPVYIRCIWGFWRHSLPLVSIANSRALALAGVTRETASPWEGVTIERDPATGEPSGVFRERTFVPVVELTLMRGAPGFTHAHRVQALRDSMRAYNACGTTSVFEEHGVAAEVIRAYKELWCRGELTVRCHLLNSPSWDTVGGAGRAEAVLEGWATWADGPGLGDAMLRISGLFVEVNASPENALRRTSMPYTGWAGFSYDAALGPQEVRGVLLAAARNGLRVAHLYAELLDHYEAVDREVPIRNLRWIVGHIHVLTPRQIERMAHLGLVVTLHTNRYLWKEGAALRRRMGPDGEDSIVPLRRLREAGVPFALATDNVPVSLFFPLWQVVARRDRETGEVIGPSQRLTREEALRAATLDAARLTFDEGAKGSIEAGKLADLAVLRQDYLTVPEDAIKDIAVDLTMVGGRVVYERPG